MSGQRPLARVDIVMVIDVTGSMGPYIQGVFLAVDGFMQILTEGGVDPCFGLVLFRDEKYGEMPECYDLGIPPERIRAILNQTKAKGGGDEEESSLPAIKRALGLGGYREGAQRILLFITDAPPREPEHGLTSESILAMLRDNAAVLFACTHREEPYSTFANATQGMLFPIEPGLKPETFKDVLLSVAHVTVKQTLNMQQSRTIQDVAREELRKTQILVNKREGE
jgi:hypothetical protein